MTQTAKRPRTPKKTQVAAKKVTHIVFLIDESGSMSPTATDVRGGFNTYVENLKKDGNEYTITCTKFGTTFRPLFKNLALADVPKLTALNYMPLDSTALYDAIGYALDQTKEQYATPEKPYGEDRFLFIIMTDGWENSSRKFTKEVITDRIKRREEAGNWTFVYMGADQDAWAVGAQLGLAKDNVLSYASSSTPGVFHRLTEATTATSSSSQSSTRGFFTNP